MGPFSPVPYVFDPPPFASVLFLIGSCTRPCIFVLKGYFEHIILNVLFCGYFF